MPKRTDLAIESAALVSDAAALKGVSQKVYEDHNADLVTTEISVNTESASKVIGKPIGKYVTIENKKGSFSLYSNSYNEQVNALKTELLKLIPQNCQRIMFAGLGNRRITPDSLGPLTADKIFATRHIKMLAKDIDTSDLADVSVITTGVMAQTGVESSENVKALVDHIKPDLVVIVDALACSQLSHLGSTIQLTDTGICPGSGVENSRKELSENTLDVPCIAIGVPTVSDMDAIAADISADDLPEKYKGMLVTPKSIDELTSKTSALISSAINRAFHPTLTDEEISSLIS